MVRERSHPPQRGRDERLRRPHRRGHPAATSASSAAARDDHHVPAAARDNGFRSPFDRLGQSTAFGLLSSRRRPGTMALMPRLAKTLLIIAALPLVLLAGWQRVIEPSLVKIPGDVNRTNHYSGTVSVFVDQKTTIDLPTPQESPMTIVRTAKSVPGGTGATTTELRETDNISLLGQNAEQPFVFVLDRSSARNVFDERATAFGNNVNRHGAYYPNLTFGVDSSRHYAIWNTEAGVPYAIERQGGAETTTINGVSVLRMQGTLPMT